MALVVPTAAVTLSGTGDTVSDDVVLDPADERYASIRDDQLRLDLEALNDRAITTADDVFAITVTDDAVERVWIENDLEGLEFYERDDPASEITRSNPLESSAGETVRVGVAVDTRVARAGTETFTVRVAYEEEPDEDDDDDESEDDDTEAVTLESLAVEPTALEVGESVTVEATYRNEDRAATRHTARLTVDGTVVDSRTVEIGAGETRSVTFEREMQWPGGYEVGVDGAAGERVTVRGAGADVSAATVSETELTRGDRTTVSATVRNPTDRSVERTLEPAVDGVVVDARTVVVRPGTERTVTFDRRFDAAGTYDLSVSGVDAGAVTVSEPGPFRIRDRELPAATTAVLAPPLVTGALFLGAAANRRWAIVPFRYRR